MSEASKSYQRLSSGQRITGASDDAAGLSIADTLNVKTRLYSTAIRNINDGVSVLAVIGSALESQHLLLTRMNELAEQSANGVYTDSQRQALNKEYQALVQEFGRIAGTAQCNGQTFLNGANGGSISRLALQAGVDGASTSAIAIQLQPSASYTGVIGATGDYNGTGDLNALDLSISNGIFLGGEMSLDRLHQMSKGAVAYATITDSYGEERELYIALVDFPWSDQGKLWVFTPEITSRPATVLDGTTGATAGKGLDLVGATNFVDAAGSTHQLSLNFINGAFGSATVDFRSLTIAPVTGVSEFARLYSVYGTSPETSFRPTAINFTGVETVKRSSFALTVVTNRMEDLTQLRSEFGAMESRLAAAEQHLASSRVEAETSESRIRDVDVAEESARLIRSKILEQTAIAVAAQAKGLGGLVELLL